ncbi:MAG: hypothetical protein JSV03_16435 [Planctomycetota bacterium]|nr:MAG: hypothetical protein JSV03_16435 [Planctomycetota bacterium]
MNNQDKSGSQNCLCEIDRRALLKLAGLGAASVVGIAPSASMAGESTVNNTQDHLVPADKKLDPEWLKSLFARGEPTVYSGRDLDFIGMPVGGICTGQLYLGGDGKLWHWDIFNQHIKTKDEHYAQPPKPTSPLDQGFAVKITTKNNTQVRRLDRTGFPNVSFRGEYPIGFADYFDELFPVNISLEAFSPFIPLNAEDSGLPATVMQFTITNSSDRQVLVELAGWLENAVCLDSSKHFLQQADRQNRILQESELMLLECSVIPRQPTSLDKKDSRETNSKTNENNLPLNQQNDFGTMSLALLGSQEGDRGISSLPEGNASQVTFTGNEQDLKTTARKPFDQRLRGGLVRKVSLEPGREANITFVVAWCFPNLRLPGINGVVGRQYDTRFTNAPAVMRYIKNEFDRLISQTRLWHRTWYDSTLPYWLLDRVGANFSILASSTCSWWANGRFYGWEGVGCCKGTCTHVWYYAHTVARLFPSLERSTRQMQDLGAGFDPKSGMVFYRGGLDPRAFREAIDGQAGVILRSYREHQMSPDDKFLKYNWPKIRKATQFLIDQDGDADGVITGKQHNTLDAAYFGHNSVISSLYLAALRAAETMANEVGDQEFARQLPAIINSGARHFLEKLWNGEYFIHKPDPKFPQALKYDNGCFIDQVLGQSWAFQIGLGRILPEEKVKKGLRSLWKYNFTRDVGPYREVHQNGRWYAMPGEGGLIMCTWPKGRAPNVPGKIRHYGGYYNECMTGFEYQAAAHMIWEGMVMEGLAICRTIHDRYHASKRNPFNEIECGDHYARAMASYGVFVALCGYEYHGPKGYLSFAPRHRPEDFRAPFTSANGWGTYSQKRNGDQQQHRIDLRWGNLRLNKLTFIVPHKWRSIRVSAETDGKIVILTADKPESGHVSLWFKEPLILKAKQVLTVLITHECP